MKSLVILCGIFLTVLAAPEAPYPPKGWRPNGQQFALPSKEYGSPSQTYGPAEETTETSTTTEQSTEQDGQTAPGRFQQKNRVSSRFTQSNGQYFIITPEGRVQQVSIPSNQENRREFEYVDDNTVNRTPLGRLVQLPVSNTQLKQRESQRTGRLQQVSQENVAEYFALTSDGRLQKLQPGQRLQTDQQKQLLVLLPSGRFQKVQANNEDVSTNQENGQYHLLLPSGKLQRVQYMNVLSPDNKLSANVQYREVDPIPGPLYTFGAPLVRVA